MKNLFITLLSLLTMTPSIAQVDSTIVKYSSIENEDIRAINMLNGIQFLRIECEDVKMKNKKFLLYLDEFKLGEKVNSDTVFNCTNTKYPVIIGQDTMIYYINPCSRARFPEEKNKFTIRLAAKYENDSLSLNINYPNVISDYRLGATKRYSLRPLGNLQDMKKTIEIGKKTPIVTYTPPYKMSSNINSYCTLSQDSPNLWYTKYDIDHFYVISLKIE